MPQEKKDVKEENAVKEKIAERIEDKNTKEVSTSKKDNTLIWVIIIVLVVVVLGIGCCCGIPGIISLFSI
jgi:NADH:ubiquinone oxidoreductase subunit B-like Fe-S oxidoreductase